MAKACAYLCRQCCFIDVLVNSVNALRINELLFGCILLYKCPYSNNATLPTSDTKTVNQ